MNNDNVKVIQEHEIMAEFIENGELDKIKNLVFKKFNLHHADDYFLYLAVFYKQTEIQEYLIDMGLDPEVTKSRLAVADPEGLDNIIFLKKKKEIKEYYEKIAQSLPPKENKDKKLKL